MVLALAFAPKKNKWDFNLLCTLSICPKPFSTSQHLSKDGSHSDVTCIREFVACSLDYIRGVFRENHATIHNLVILANCVKYP